MDPVAFLLGYLAEHAKDSLQFQKDVWESFMAVAEDMEAVLKRLEAVEHNIDLKVVGMIVPKGEA